MVAIRTITTFSSAFFAACVLASPIPQEQRREASSPTSLEDVYPGWNRNHGGTNVLLAADGYGSFGAHIEINNPQTDSNDLSQQIKKLVRETNEAGGGILRIGFPVEFWLDDNYNALVTTIFTAANQEGLKHGVAIQLNPRSATGRRLNPNELKQLKRVLKEISDTFGRTNFIIDTVNEASSGDVTLDDDWVRQQADLVKIVRDQGFKGFIAIEDYAWGGGLTTGEQTLFKDEHFSKIMQSNGGYGSDRIIGSIHVYDKSSKGRVKKALDAITSVGALPQIGEYGNYNAGGDQPYRYSGILDPQTYLRYNKDEFLSQDGTILAWCDQYTKGGKPEIWVDGSGNYHKKDGSAENPGTHGYGFTASEQILNDEYEFKYKLD